MKRNKEIFAMPFLVERYLKKTAHLSLEEHGAYCLLLFGMWLNKGVLQANDDDLARWLRVSPEQWQRLKPRLMPFMETYGSDITQQTLQEQWNWAVQNSARQSEKGSRGGKAKWEKVRLLAGIGNSTGNAPANSTGNSKGNGTGYSPALASKNNNITDRSYQKNTDGPLAPKPPPEIPDLPPVLDRRSKDVSKLLKTPLMRRTAG